MTVLIYYFAANPCTNHRGGDDFCKATNDTCRRLDGFDYDCVETTLPPEVCNANPCCESGPNPLCCQNGVCSNENFVYNATTDNADECSCLCTDNFSGEVKYRNNHTYKKINGIDSLDFISVSS